MTDEPCADVSRRHNEPLWGTASRVRSWLLVEEPGAWGRDAVIDSDIDPSVARRLKVMAAQDRVRLLLIRRPRGGVRRERECFALHTGLQEQWAQRIVVEDLVQLLDLDFGALREGARPASGDAWDEPLYLVCTNGAHDPCCERYGRPVAVELGVLRPSSTWESSHLGGDRFAANLVCLPHGLYFGRVGAEDAPELAELYEEGLIHLDHFRGRSCLEPVVQAADVMLRRLHGFAGIDDLVPEARRDHGGGRSTLTFRDRFGVRHEIGVAVGRGEKRPLTCAAKNPGAVREYALASKVM
ncbi:MAG: sucrase ferredoxin [Actinomycetota bacterium]